MTASGLYLGTVMHNRVKPVRHLFSYKVFSVLVDLDEVAVLGLRTLTHNRFGLLSFHDRDHGPGDGSPLKPWIAARLAEAGITAGGPVQILCFPRVLGFVFNPLSVWFCHAADGTLAATVHEVSNTFGQKHFYIIPASVEADGLIHQDCAKAFYVSPFMPMATDYHFRILPPGERVSVIIRQTDAEGTVFHASLAGRRVPLSDRALLGAFFRHPLMTLKVVAGIHLEALRLWRKGMTLQPRPEILP